jgi:hypothetical protein
LKPAWFGAALLLIVLALLTANGLRSTTAGTPCTFINNAAWISVDWTSQPIKPDAVRQLATDAERHHLKYLFPYTTYVRQDGFSQSYSYAAEFVSEFRKTNHDTKLLAWIGVPLKPTREFGVPGWVELSDPDQRARIIEFVAQLVTEAGFDGVHLNVETVWDGDRDYLNFLDEMRKALGEEKMLSVAVPAWLPPGSPPHPAELRWRSPYYAEVGQRVDQIAAMTYDSQSSTAAEYQGWLATQITGIDDSIKKLNTEVLIGLSVSREQTFTHLPEIENIRNSLPAICKAKSGINGIAVYASWEATSEDWAEWDRWVRP